MAKNTSLCVFCGSDDLRASSQCAVCRRSSMSVFAFGGADLTPRSPLPTSGYHVRDPSNGRVYTTPYPAALDIEPDNTTANDLSQAQGGTYPRDQSLFCTQRYPVRDSLANPMPWSAATSIVAAPGSNQSNGSHALQNPQGNIVPRVNNTAYETTQDERPVVNGYHNQRPSQGRVSRPEPRGPDQLAADNSARRQQRLSAPRYPEPQYQPRRPGAGEEDVDSR